VLKKKSSCKNYHGSKRCQAPHFAWGALGTPILKGSHAALLHTSSSRILDACHNSLPLLFLFFLYISKRLCRNTVAGVLSSKHHQSRLLQQRASSPATPGTGRTRPVHLARLSGWIAIALAPGHASPSEATVDLAVTGPLSLGITDSCATAAARMRACPRTPSSSKPLADVLPCEISRGNARRISCRLLRPVRFAVRPRAWDKR
jgi:hypothetical protein